MNDKPVIAVLYHIFYEDTFEKICSELHPLLSFNSFFYFNVCIETPDKCLIITELKKKFPGCYIICTSNRGKDIGGKLALVALLLRLRVGADLILLLHDKKSLQALKSNTWKQDLLKIISPENIRTALRYFEDEKCGIVATKEYVVSEPFVEGSFAGINAPLLSHFVTKNGINPPNYLYIAGTMFWVRGKALEFFFSLNNPLEFRSSLEDGNVLDNFSGTLTHTWERVFSWIVTMQGFVIKGI